MPLFEKTRIEVYLPDLPRLAYKDFLASLQEELTYTFGGCSVNRGVEGFFLGRIGQIMRDRVNILHTDADIAFERNLDRISAYADQLRQAASEALEEEVILVVAFKVYHCA